MHYFILVVSRVFEGKGQNAEGKKLRALTDSHVTYTINGWFNNDTTEEYLNFLYPYNMFEKKRNRLLIWDSYRCHISEATRGILKKKDITQWSSLMVAQVSFRHLMCLGMLL